jgi:metal-sulfur cluster biosynthetic enzyme
MIDRAVRIQEIEMDEDKFNMSLRKFLKHVGVTSQREIEKVAREGNTGQSKLKVKMVLTAAGTDLNHVIEQDIELR